MMNFSPLEYIKISVANAYGHGLDRENWDKRLDWFDNDMGSSGMRNCVLEADEPILMEKGLRAYTDAIDGIPTGYIMGLDATASNLQIMSCLIGCPITARNNNVINTGNREDGYTKVATDMKLPRKPVKKPVMTTFFGSKAQPAELFGIGTPELQEFYESLQEHFPGAMEWMDDVQSCWDSTALSYTFNALDGHTAYIKVMKAVDKPIEIDEMDHATFTHRLYENIPKGFGVFLAAHIVHATDGYIVREMYRMAEAQGFELLTIHDSFWSSPNFMQNVRENYLTILRTITESNIMQSMLRQITGRSDLVFTKRTEDMSSLMVNAEYALS